MDSSRSPVLRTWLMVSCGRLTSTGMSLWSRAWGSASTLLITAARTWAGGSRRALSKGRHHCHLHHSQFDLADGHVVRWTDWSGAVLTIAEPARHPRPLRTYEVKIEDGKVFVGPEIPPPAEAPEVY